ncbi:hypothetical protein Esti_000520 [Eimeria stiedai]
MGDTQREQALRWAPPEQLLQTLKTLGRNKEELQGLLQDLLAENASLQISRKKLREEKAELQRELEQQRRDLSLFQAVLLDLGIPTFPELLPRQGAKGKRRQGEEGPALTRGAHVAEVTRGPLPELKLQARDTQAAKDLRAAVETGSAAWAVLGESKPQATAAAASKGAIEFFIRRLPWLQEGGGAPPRSEARGAPTCSSSPSALHTTHHESSSPGPPPSSTWGPLVGEGFQKGAPKALLESLKTTSRGAHPRSPAAGAGAPSLLDLLAESEAASRSNVQQRETETHKPLVKACEAAAQCSSNESTSSCSSNGCNNSSSGSNLINSNLINSSISMNSSPATATSRSEGGKTRGAATCSDRSSGDSSSNSSSTKTSSSSKVSVSGNRATQEQWNCRARLLALQIGEALGLERSSGAFAAAAEATAAAEAATVDEAAAEVTTKGRESPSVAAAAATSSTAATTAKAEGAELVSGALVAAAVEADAAIRDSSRPSLCASSALQQPVPAATAAAKPRLVTISKTEEIGPPSASQASTGPLVDLPSLITEGPSSFQPLQSPPRGFTADESAEPPAGEASGAHLGAPCALTESPPSHNPLSRSKEMSFEPQSAASPGQDRGVKACDLLPLQTTSRTSTDRRCSSNSTTSRRSSSSSTISSTASSDRIAAAAPAPVKQHHLVASPLASSRDRSTEVGVFERTDLGPSPAPKTLWDIQTPTQQQVPAARPPATTKVAAAPSQVEAGRARPALEAPDERVRDNPQKMEGPFLEVDVVSVEGGGLRVSWEVKEVRHEGALQLQACVLDCSSSSRKHQQHLLHSSRSPLVISSLRSSGSFHLTLLVREQPQEEDEQQQQRPLCAVSIQLTLEEGRVINKRIRSLPVNRLFVRGMQSPKAKRTFSGATLVGAPTPRSSSASVPTEAATSQNAAEHEAPVNNIVEGSPKRKERSEGGPCRPISQKESLRLGKPATDQQPPAEHSHTNLLRVVCTPEGPAGRAEEQPSKASIAAAAAAAIAVTPRSAAVAAVKLPEAAVVLEPAEALTATAVAPTASVSAQSAAAAASAASAARVSPRNSAAAAQAAAAKAAAMMGAPIPSRRCWIPSGPQGVPLSHEGDSACDGLPQPLRGAPNLQLTRTYLREMIRTSSGAPTGESRQRSLTPIRDLSQASWMPCGPHGNTATAGGPPLLSIPNRNSWTPCPFTAQPTHQILDTTSIMKGPLLQGAPNTQGGNGFAFGVQGPQLPGNPVSGLSTQRWACIGTPLPYQGSVAAPAGAPQQMSWGLPWFPAFPATGGRPLSAQEPFCMVGPPQTTAASPLRVEEDPLHMRSRQIQRGASTAGEARVQDSHSFVRGPPMGAPQASVHIHSHTGPQCNLKISTAPSVRRGSLTQVGPLAAMGPHGFTWCGRDGANNLVQREAPLNISLGAPSSSRSRSVTPTYKPTAFLREALNNTLKGLVPPQPAAQPYPVTPRGGPPCATASNVSFRGFGGPPMAVDWGTTAVPPLSRMSLSLPQACGPPPSAGFPDATLSGPPQKPAAFPPEPREAQDPRPPSFVSGYQWQQQQKLVAKQLQMQQFQVQHQVQQQQLQQRQQTTMNGLQEPPLHEHQAPYKGLTQQPITVPRDTRAETKQQQQQLEQQQQQQQKANQFEKQQQQQHPLLPLRRIRGLDPPPHEQKLTQWVCLSEKERQARGAGPV